jgi:hypothetical protein
LLQRQFAEARIALHESLAISRAMNDGAGAAFALRYLGFLASADADYESAAELLDESLTVARGVGSMIDVATASVGWRSCAEMPRWRYTNGSSQRRGLEPGMAVEARRWTRQSAA